MDTLYYSPGACSLAVHIVLEEIGRPFETVRVPIPEGAHRRPEYLAINPRARVPALRTEGTVITEVGAILSYLADRERTSGAPTLAPAPGTLARARFQEWLSWLSSSVHIAFAQIWRGERFSDDASVHGTIAETGRRTVRAFYREIDTRLETVAKVTGHPHALEEGSSAVDPYLTVFYRWGHRIGEPMEGYRSLERLAHEVAARPAAKRALARENVTLTT
ncbi:glutathione S-transferase N-terminal domain-containing protein [Pendulispora rubella]|uniref:Glutathione S-transferase N-terminal domain-containing protein n=1 Tax=Pendulispora rubella TaxID=2741070 RepID=A0ABZ2L497_9BACT